MKKIYIEPTMQVVKIQRRYRLLVGSEVNNTNDVVGSKHMFSRGGNSDDGYEE